MEPEDLPRRGRFVGREHRFPVRVFFEDTDLSGVVYHANFLRYMERARSDMLAMAGIDQRQAWGAGQGVYVVADLSIRYRRSAKLDDDLLVVTTLKKVATATVTIHQRVMLDGEILTDATVLAAFVQSGGGRPKRQPREWLTIFEGLLEE
ncbi:YbgC/FadM family acyl-CoA thioesterase [Sphingomonas sp.]|jgi:acyl-CoA thioester hydrolase|uniref:YbgC/FadM family acyl-CoA thioesterase n=1 Tax=Sphingomonas sp. TaxID=28214 RepID=UPI002DEDC680|nr:YbgC/FadM family acyl-CoA thioesterase [Sphingomonas sp.]HEV2569845.1 YbgC/FadM family acyl-CoA thioesterase [Sphingomonas sp.]